MKLFNENTTEVLEYLKLPLINNENELEVIFGSTPYKNPINKGVFIRTLEECKKAIEGKIKAKAKAKKSKKKVATKSKASK